MAVALFNWENLAARITEFAENLTEPLRHQTPSNGIGNASSLFLWAEYLARTGPGMHPKKLENFMKNEVSPNDAGSF